MSLSPRSIAVQGFGFASRHVALQGLTPYRIDVGPRGGGSEDGLARSRARTAYESEMLDLAMAIILSGALDG